MTQYIDRHDAEAIKRTVERELRQHADDAIKAIAPALLGKPEHEARAILERMAERLCRIIDDVERQFLDDLDAVAIEAD